MEAKDWLSVIALVISCVSLYFVLRKDETGRELQLARKREQSLNKMARARLLLTGMMGNLREIFDHAEKTGEKGLSLEMGAIRQRCRSQLKMLDQGLTELESMDFSVRNTHKAHLLIEKVLGRSEMLLGCAEDLSRDVEALLAKRLSNSVAAASAASAGE